MKKMMAASDFIKQMQSFDAQTVTQSQLKSLGTRTKNGKFNYDDVKRVSFAGAQMCEWVLKVEEEAEKKHKKNDTEDQ